MTKTKKLISILVVVLMTVSLFASTFAMGAADATDKDAANLDYLVFNTFENIDGNPGYGAPVPAGIVFIDDDWCKFDSKENKFVALETGTWVYIRYTESGKVYKLQMGINAFFNIQDVMRTVARDNLIIKFGPGKYSSDYNNLNNSGTAAGLKIANAGMKIYGNYAGVNPNELDPTDDFNMLLSSKRQDKSLESTLDSVKWVWAANTAHNITIDGFYASGETTNTVTASGKQSVFEDTVFTNNIVTGNNGGLYKYWVDANAGTTYGMKIMYNRIYSTNCRVFIGGGGMLDILFDNNFIYDNPGIIYDMGSCGDYGAECVLSFSHNILKNNGDDITFSYSGGGGAYGVNLFYHRVVGNKIDACGKNAKAVFTFGMNSAHPKPADMPPDQLYTSSASKTLISGNTFKNMPTNVVPLAFTGTKLINGSTVNFVVAINENKFLFTGAGGTAVRADFDGTIDMSRNFYGNTSTGAVVSTGVTDKTINASSRIKFIATPYYLDEAMTQLSGAIDLVKGADSAIEAGGMDASSFVIDNKKVVVSATAKAGVETVDFTNTILGENVTLEIYNDFLLNKKESDNKIDLTGDITRAYLIATDKKTGQATRYNLLITANTDKTKADFRYLLENETNEEYKNITVSGTTVTVALDTSDIYFPFSIVVSPSATYKLYSDAQLTTEYDDARFYMQPDKETVVYAKVVSGDAKTTKTYKFVFNRKGSSEFDARINLVTSPEQNVLLFNNERKAIVYRPYGLIREETFDFEVSQNAKYTIYKTYKNGVLSDAVSKSDDVKAIPIDDAINYYYVEIVSAGGYKQVYTLTIYNDVKSSDNVITGIKAVDGVTVEGSTIYVQVDSPTLTSINANFETSPFADVVTYAGKDKAFKLTPNITTEVINNREVEIRTFALGIASQVSYFGVEVTSETGEKREYDVVVTRGASDKTFTDTKGHWAEEVIKEAARIGIIGGYLNEASGTYTFKPNQTATRQEVAAMFLRSLGVDPLSFKNVTLGDVFNDADSISDWAYNYVKGAYSLGIMKGDNEKNYKPSAKITRQEFFQAVANMLKLDINAASNYDLSKFSDASTVASWAVPATKAVIKAGIVEGSNGKINPKSNITRAEIAKILTITNIIADDVK